MRHYCNSPYFSSKFTVHACTQVLMWTVVYENVRSTVGRRILNLYIDLQISLPWKYSSDVAFLFLTKDSLEKKIFFFFCSNSISPQTR